MITKRNKYILLFTIVAFLLGIILKGAIYEPSLYSIIFAIITTFIFYTTDKEGYRSRYFLGKVILISFIVKIIMVFVFEQIMIQKIGMPFLSYNDDYVYEETSSNILKIWRINGFGFYNEILYSTGFYSGYPNFSAVAKFLFGDHYLVPRFMNVIFSTLTIPLFYKSLLFFTSEKIAKTVTLLFSFSAVFIVYSSLQLKDTILIFFLSLLVYGTIKFFKDGFRIKTLFIIILSIVTLIFFRAAILLPYIIAIIVSQTIVRQRKVSKLRNVANILGVIIIILGFIYAWNYLNNSGLLSLTSSEYFESRFSSRGEANTYQGSNDFTKIGVLSILLGPILLLFSFFLPTPVFVQLDTMTKSVAYQYLPTLDYYSILPMIIVGVLFLFKNFKAQRVGIFLFIFFLLYKLGQAGSKSIFDSRQSLPAIYMGYLLLGFFDLDNSQVKKLWVKYKTIIVLIMLLVMFGFTYSRILIRQ